MAAWRGCLLVVALVSLAPLAAQAQGAGRSMDIETSVRALGMGGASAGVAWGDPDVWGNVASLSRVTGVVWDQSRAQLVPGLATDVIFRSRRILLGGGGIGVNLMGMPLPIDGVKLDYGTSDNTDGNGVLLGTFQSYETVRGVGLAVSVPALVAALARSPGGVAEATQAFDVSVGVAGKHTHIALAPSPMWGTASATTWDFGLQGRFSPLALAEGESAEQLRRTMVLDVGAGIEGLNMVGGKFVFRDEDMSSPATKLWREGAAIRVGMHMPLESFDERTRVLLQGCDPLIALSVAYDHTNGSPSTVGWTTTHRGLEIAVANVLTYRVGRYVDRAGSIDGSTSGRGIGVRVGPWGGFRYDESTQPQATDSGLPDVKHKAWVVWVDALRTWRDLGSANGGGGH
jgi:hypothetical protein